MELVEAGDIGRKSRTKSLRGPNRDEKGAGAAGEGDEERFDGELTEESGTRGTDS